MPRATAFQPSVPEARIGRAHLRDPEAAPITYRFDFDRVGRHTIVNPLLVGMSREEEARPDLAHMLAAHLVLLCRRYLASRDLMAVVNLDEMRGAVFAGPHSVGTCTLVRMAAMEDAGGA